jgi:hypothetical protein
MNILKDPYGPPEIFEMLRSLDLVEFNTTYLSLANLLARLRHSTHTQVTFATPPGKTTVPQDPNRSGGSTSTSSSTESKPEPYAQNVAANFLSATYSTVAQWMVRLEWVNPDAKLYLSPQYAAIHLSNCSALEKMEIRLGKVQMIKAIDDGGVSMYFRRDPSSTQLSRRVILSVEVSQLTTLLTKAKRKKHTKENDHDTAYRHASQIYAEMLGQACHSEFYHLMDNEYQEVFSFVH